MEYTTVETNLVELALSESIQAQLRELSELHLAFVGGGAGDVTLS
jgi:hypothetical protein